MAPGKVKWRKSNLFLHYAKLTGESYKSLRSFIYELLHFETLESNLFRREIY